jgi:hypothetical protein
MGRSLFEVRTDKNGYSYERAYVWADSEEHARKLFAEKHGQELAVKVIPLFAAYEDPFCTALSDEGFPNLP